MKLSLFRLGPACAVLALSAACLSFACTAPTGADDADARGDGDGDIPGDGDGDGDSSSTGGSGPDGGSGGAGSDPSSGGGSGDSGGGSNEGSGGASSGPPPGATALVLPYTEDFEDGFANDFIADIDDELAALGSWSVADDGGNQVYQQTQVTDDYTFAVGGDFHWTDQRFESRFKVLSGVADGIVLIAARVADFDHYYYLEISESRIKLRIRNDGNVDITEWDLPADMLENEWHTVVLSAIGTTVSVEFDGAVAMTVTDAQLSSGGIAFGARDCSVAFDDVSVTAE